MNLAEENAGLRKQLEVYRERELIELRQQLAESRQLVAHYHAEAERNAEVGRKIAMEAREQITELKSKLEARDELRTTRR